MLIAHEDTGDAVTTKVTGLKVVKNMFRKDMYGGVETKTLYLRRVFLSPMTRKGQLVLHIFYRPDTPGEDMHNHPNSFWTFCLYGGYLEECMLPINHEPVAMFPFGRKALDALCSAMGLDNVATTLSLKGKSAAVGYLYYGSTEVVVKPGKLMFRAASHVHKVVKLYKKICITLVWMNPDERDENGKVKGWGFWNAIDGLRPEASLDHLPEAAHDREVASC